MSSSYYPVAPPGRGSSWLARWIAIIALCGAGSVAAVRLATPSTLDEAIGTFVLFFVLPGIVILLLRVFSRSLASILALAIPFVWLSLSRDPSDSLKLWLIPGLTLVLILLAARIARAGAAQWAVAFAAIVLGLAAMFWPAAHRPGPGPKVLVVGLDGATWDLIDPFISKGRMPVLERATGGGHRAKLRTLDTMLSPQIWSTMATGCTPDVHGVLDFAYRQNNFRVGRIWDRLKHEGRSFGLCGWYFTWPPEPGVREADFIVPSRYAPDDQVFPPEYSFYREVEGWVRKGERRGFRTDLRSYLSAGARAWRHGIRLSTLRMGVTEVLGRRFTDRRELDDHWRARQLSVSLQADLFAELLRTRRPEFAAVLFTQIDHVSHKYWKYMQPAEFPEVTRSEKEKYGRVIENIYAEADRALGKILEVTPDDTEVLIVSDHGFQALHQTDAERHCRIRTTDLIDVLGLTDGVFGTNVDEEVYLRGMAPAREERETVIGKIELILREARVIGEEKPLFDVSREGEVLHLHLASRPAVPEDASVLLDGVEYPFGRVVRARREAFNSGGHHSDGIYLLSGPSATRAVKTDSLHVLDIAPTIAALLRLPVSPLWQGRPAIEGISIAELGVAEYPPPSDPEPPPTHIDEDLRKRLKALGYLE